MIKNEKKQIKKNEENFKKEMNNIQNSIDKTIELYEEESKLETIFIGLGAYASVKEEELTNSFFYDTVQNLLIKYTFITGDYNQEQVSVMCREFLQKRLNDKRASK